MKGDEGHPIEGITHAGAQVQITCGCGWTSAPAATETEARALHDAHWTKAQEGGSTENISTDPEV